LVHVEIDKTDGQPVEVVIRIGQVVIRIGQTTTAAADPTRGG
jgi:hypothetical protein